MEIKDLFREGGCHLAGSPPQTWDTQNPSAIGLGRALHHGEQNLAPCLVEGGARGAGGMQFGEQSVMSMRGNSIKAKGTNSVSVCHFTGATHQESTESFLVVMEFSWK